MEKVNGVVIGGGVVGLAVARGLAQAASSNAKEWYLLEAADTIGTGISSRNSEVIHAGIYYPQGSLKAKLCVQGRGLLYNYAIERGVAHKRCGKLIVATNPKQLQTLANIKKNAIANGVNDLVWLTAKQAMQMEPTLFCVAALHSPSTGIVDSRDLMLNLQGDFENVGGVVALNSQVVSARHTDNGFDITMADGTKLLANVLINAAGLNAPWLAHKIDGLKKDFVPQAFFAKGNYFALTGRAPFSHLIYPVPEVSGLGVHLTLDLGGQAKFGPDVQWVTSPNDLNVSTELEPVFYEEVRKYWPTLTDGALTPGFAGIRPKISGPHETPADFCIQGPAIHGLRGLVNLFGIESPGLTSSLAIAGAVVKALEA